MTLKERLLSYIKIKTSTQRIEEEKDKILQFLIDLKKQEAKLWGVLFVNIETEEEKIIEDTNHLVYLVSKKKYKKLKEILKKKDYKEFEKDVLKLKADFNLLKKSIKGKDRLKLLISNYTIKLVNNSNYSEFKDVFLLERMLSDVLDNQEEELNILVRDLSKIKFSSSSEERVELFQKQLEKIRNILGGHIENYKLFDEERHGYSNTSNIIHELIKIFKTNVY